MTRRRHPDPNPDPTRARGAAAMTRLLCMLLVAGPAAAQEITAPSGQPIALHDVVIEQDAGLARFLFVAPGISLEEGAGRTHADLQDDFPWLCETVIRPGLAENGIAADEVVISLSDRVVPFGETDLDAVQFFEVFSVTDSGCVWEGF